MPSNSRASATGVVAPPWSLLSGLRVAASRRNRKSSRVALGSSAQCSPSTDTASSSATMYLQVGMGWWAVGGAGDNCAGMVRRAAPVARRTRRRAPRRPRAELAREEELTARSTVSAEPIASAPVAERAIWRKWARRAAATTSAPSVTAPRRRRAGGPSAAATRRDARTAAAECAASEDAVLVSQGALAARSTSRPRTGDARAAARGHALTAAAGERRHDRAVVVACRRATDCCIGGSTPRRRRPRSPPARAHRSCARRARGARGTASRSHAPSSAATTAPAAASASSVQQQQ